jgi:hypothetical protein
MRHFTIPKKNGRVRHIYAPDANEKADLRATLPVLNALSAAHCADCVHGFIRGRNAVTAAMPHIGYAFTLSVDLRDFFDNVSDLSQIKADISAIPNLRRLFPFLTFDIIEKYVAKQGLPTSPAVANIAAVPLDDALLEYCRTDGIVYTRYADDLSFSHNDKDVLLRLRDQICYIAAQAGFEVNPNKTRLQWGGKDGTWTREIVGVGVNAVALVPLRKSRRKERATKHNLDTHPCKHNRRILRGIQEWNSLKQARDADYPARAKRAVGTALLLHQNITLPNVK